MKQRRLVLLLSASALLLSAAAFAHDPSEHKMEEQKPDCSAMQKMDHSKMNINDPVMQAMMQKCMKGMHEEEAQTSHDHAAHESTDATKKTEK